MANFQNTKDNEGHEKNVKCIFSQSTSVQFLQKPNQHFDRLNTEINWKYSTCMQKLSS